MLDPQNSPNEASSIYENFEHKNIMIMLGLFCIIIILAIVTFVIKSDETQSITQGVNQPSSIPAEIPEFEIPKIEATISPTQIRLESPKQEISNSKELIENKIKDKPIESYQDTLFQSALQNLYSPRKKIKNKNIKPSITKGTIIPAILQSGVNSDLNGNVLARVARNIYDSLTGTNIVIPAGSKLIGTYNSSTILGQERLLLLWSTLQLPNGTSVDLNAMASTDLEGKSGINGDVNNHYGRILGSSIILSIVGTSQQLSGLNTDSSPDSILSKELTHSLSKTSNQLIARDLQIKPTIELPPGKKFNIFVNKDLFIQEWSG